MTEREMFDAVVARLRELNYGPGPNGETIPERARRMLDSWYYFSSKSVDDRGHETCRDWLDAELVRLFDASLRARWR